mmetsp:Transcript_35452/g.113260  ORF Transcript_35452/g.113260 Transcript_35452/m.113260 type:complete len:227 (-) Transcript_35452:519-1199(-)
MMMIEVLNGVDEELGVVFGRGGFDAVAEVHDVVLAVGDSEDFLGLGLDGFLWPVPEEGGVEVALDADVIRDDLPGLGEVDGVVDGDDVGPRGGELGEALAFVRVLVGGHVDDDGDLGMLRFDGGDDLLLVSQGELVEGRVVEVAGPGIEDLDDLGAGVDLVTSVLGDICGEHREDGVQQVGILPSHRRDFRELGLRARLAFDEVRRQGEGQAHEAEDRRVRLHGFP